MIDLAEGDRIRITAQIPGVWIVPRVQVGTFLELRSRKNDTAVLVFSLRPLAGTQDLPVQYITEIEKVGDDVPIQVPTKVPGH